MAVNLKVAQAADLHPVLGVRWGIAQAGIRKLERDDVAVLLLQPGASIGAVFTQNKFCAAPVQTCRTHLAKGLARDWAEGADIRALLINTGNANAGTGAEGLQRTELCCQALAQVLNLAPEQVLPFSTGVIMEMLPHDKLIAALPAALQDAQENNWARAARAIMTTDTLPKACSRQLEIDGVHITITGISKGAGMICPNMATMLGFIATDACVAQGVMTQLTQELADASFNCITVDGDTSTNDSFVLIASNHAAHQPITQLDSPQGKALRAALLGVAQELAQAIVRDGEGATKFITISVQGGRSSAECRQVAYAIAHSPLVKTAFFASDPNLGRILAAVGYAGIADLEQTQIDLYLDDVCVARHGGRAADYQEVDGQRVMQQSEITVRVVLGRGPAQATVWTTDLSYDYVKINADYRS